MGNVAEDLSIRIMDMSQTDPNSVSIADQASVNVSLLTRRNRRLADLNDPHRYLEISRFLQMSSMSPHWGRPIGPDSAGVTAR